MLRSSAIVSILLLFAGAPQEVREKGSLSGRIIRADSDQPLSGVRIQLAVFKEWTDDGMLLVGLPVVSATGSDGSFSFSNVAPDKYLVAVGHDGFTPQFYGPVDIESARELKNVVFRLIPEATLSGRVLSDSGFAEGMQVRLVRPGYDANGRKNLTPVANARTNDRGEYRMFGFPPGNYLLVARPDDSWNLRRSPIVNAPISQFNPSEVRPIHTETYFPGTGDRAKAETIEVKPGAEIKKDLIVVKPKTYRVRGRVIGVMGPLQGPGRTPGLSIVPVNFIDDTDGTFGISPKSDGTFEFEGLPPGRYFVMGVYPLKSGNASGTMPTAPPAQLAIVPIEVVNADLEDVIVDFAPLASVQGHLSVEGGALADMPGASAVQVELVRSEGSPRVPAVPARLVRKNNPPAADGSFTYDGIVPGMYDTRFHRLPAGAYVKDARFGAVDALGTAIQISGAKPDNLSIVLSPKAGQIQGSVADWDKRPSTNAEAVLIPDKARDRAGRYGHALVDSTGHFKIDNIAPGDYKLFVWEGIEPYAYFDPEFVRRFEDRGRPVHITESSGQTIDASRL